LRIVEKQRAWRRWEIQERNRAERIFDSGAREKRSGERRSGSNENSTVLITKRTMIHWVLYSNCFPAATSARERVMRNVRNTTRLASAILLSVIDTTSSRLITHVHSPWTMKNHMGSSARGITRETHVQLHFPEKRKIFVSFSEFNAIIV